MFEQFNLAGKVAVVTGGTGVLGRGICRTLASAGASVAILARTESTAVELADELNASGYSAKAFSCDVLDKEALETVALTILAQFGHIDILVNGAGGNDAEATAIPGQRTFFDLPEEALRWVFDLNLVGTILPSQVFGAIMAEQGTGNILNMSSMTSMQPLTRVVAYSVAKAAINNFTKWLAVYMATEHNSAIRVNAIAPGFFSVSKIGFYC